jgi:hypothetical protein
VATYKSYGAAVHGLRESSSSEEEGDDEDDDEQEEVDARESNHT